ncbi:MAG: hypothetical protein GY786_08530 [Proteobacteria bacterium]|nr:hypothetical protein [Pseudomonadota bacterium]
MKNLNSNHHPALLISKVLFYILASLLCDSVSVVFAESRLPLDIHIGFERNQVTLNDLKSGDTKTEEDSEYGNKPVFKILSPIMLGCFGKSRTWDSGTSAQRKGCFGVGLRFSAAQKRLSGSWFGLDSDTSAKPVYSYRSDQFAGEVLFGQLSQVSLAYGLGIRSGVNNYDLHVSYGDSLLVDKTNQNSTFLSWTGYLDLQVLLSWPFDGSYSWPLSPFFFMYSYEETFSQQNNLYVPDINGTTDTEVEVSTKTHTMTLELIF